MLIRTFIFVFAFISLSLFRDALAISVDRNNCEQIRTSNNPLNRSINILFIPSGYADGRGSTSLRSEFLEKVRGVADSIRTKYRPFNHQVETLNIFALKKGDRGNHICNLKSAISEFRINCREGDSVCREWVNKFVMNCTNSKVRELTRLCFNGEEAPNTRVVILDSTAEGTRDGLFLDQEDIRNPTIIPIAKNHRVLINEREDLAEITAHELGHTVFELADEGSHMISTGAWGIGKNCSRTRRVNGSALRCSEWRDLIDANMAGCQMGCGQGQSLYVSGVDNIMSHPAGGRGFGHVNLRNTCCTYKELTGSYPGYCDQYNSINEDSNLNDFCGISESEVEGGPVVAGGSEVDNSSRRREMRGRSPRNASRARSTQSQPLNFIQRFISMFTNLFR